VVTYPTHLLAFPGDRADIVDILHCLRVIRHFTKEHSVLDSHELLCCLMKLCHLMVAMVGMLRGRSRCGLCIVCCSADTFNSNGGQGLLQPVHRTEEEALYRMQHTSFTEFLFFAAQGLASSSDRYFPRGSLMAAKIGPSFQSSCGKTELPRDLHWSICQRYCH